MTDTKPSIPGPNGAHQEVAVDGEILVEEDGLVPAVVIRMPFWRAESLSESLDVWTQVCNLVDESGRYEESVLARQLLQAGAEGRARRDDQDAAAQQRA